MHSIVTDCLFHSFFAGSGASSFSKPSLTSSGAAADAASPAVAGGPFSASGAASPAVAGVGSFSASGALPAAAGVGSSQHLALLSCVQTWALSRHPALLPVVAGVGSFSASGAPLLRRRAGSVSASGATFSPAVARAFPASGAALLRWRRGLFLSPASGAALLRWRGVGSLFLSIRHPSPAAAASALSRHPALLPAATGAGSFSVSGAASSATETQPLPLSGRGLFLSIRRHFFCYRMRSLFLCSGNWFFCWRGIGLSSEGGTVSFVGRRRQFLYNGLKFLIGTGSASVVLGEEWTFLPRSLPVSIISLKLLRGMFCHLHRGETEGFLRCRP